MNERFRKDTRFKRAFEAVTRERQRRYYLYLDRQLDANPIR
jgi:hypothetical protein